MSEKLKTVQEPSVLENWLYKDFGEVRVFSKYVILGVHSYPWAECTNEEKEQWEREHPQPEPEQ